MVLPDSKGQVTRLIKHFLVDCSLGILGGNNCNIVGLSVFAEICWGID
jgi:hypothetical protein